MFGDTRKTHLPGYLVLAWAPFWVSACSDSAETQNPTTASPPTGVVGGATAAGTFASAPGTGPASSAGTSAPGVGPRGGGIAGATGPGPGPGPVVSAGVGAPVSMSGGRGGLAGPPVGTMTGAAGMSSAAEAGRAAGAAGAGNTASGGTGASGTGATATAGGGATSGSCPHVQLKGSDICTIGDSWIQIPGNQVTTLENHMKMAGVIPQGDRFDRREVSGTTLSVIVASYNNKPMNCKILVMDGGGIDLFTTPAGNQAAVMPIVQQFKAFLEKVKTDGYVQHIIYSLYPVIPSTPNLNVNMKPGYTEACEASAVDCHLVDLEPLFKGQHFGGDQTHPDQMGGVLIGDAWWKAMQENCIAQ